MPTPKPKPDASQQQEPQEFYVPMAAGELEGDLRRQPYERALRDPLEEGGKPDTLTIKDLPGRRFAVSENGGKPIIVQPGQKVSLREAESDDTFGRTIYSAGDVSEGFLTEEERLRAMRYAVVQYREDAMFRAAVDGFVLFVIGRGLKFKSKDENPEVQKFAEDFWKHNGLDGLDAECVRRFMKYGEVLVRFWNKGSNGLPAHVPTVRLVPFWRLAGIEVDAEDPERVTHFKVTPAAKIGQVAPVQPDPVPAEDCLYLAHAEEPGQRGEPPLMVIMRACTWYSDFMLKRVVLNRFRTAHVLFKKVTGGPSKVAAVDNAVQNAAKAGARGQVIKRAPKEGTVVTHNAGVEYEWKNPDTGAGDAQHDFKALKSYIAAGAMAPEFLFGDAGAANIENALMAGAPFVRKIEFIQDLFEGFFGALLRKAVEQGIKTGKLKPKSTNTTTLESGPLMRRFRKVLAQVGLSEADDNGNLVDKKEVATSTEFVFEWPPLIQKDMLKEAQTYELHQAMGLVSVETLRDKLGYDHEVEEERVQKDQEAAMDRFEQERKAEALAGGGDPEDDDDEGGAPGAKKKAPPFGGKAKKDPQEDA